MSFVLDNRRSFYVMGIVNTTPDSFYDGGNYNSLENGYKQAVKLIEEGADIIDIGGESSRPGAESVSVEEEMSRVIPLIEKLYGNFDVPISIDTVKSEVAEAALNAGASIINDISGGRRDSDIVELAAARECYTIVMHSRKSPKDMQDKPFYEDVIEEVLSELKESADNFYNAGLPKEKIILDPGIGFAKRLEDNLKILNQCSRFIEEGFEVLIGASRKSFIGALTDRDPEERLAGSLASLAIPLLQGARIFRVHDVKETVDFLKVLDGVRNS